ncbi:carbohydrate porin, partial [Nostoc sp. CMAA1605]|uniref:carbohydrate porin n=1 Tax=Nostoc sp. CMAA1605 TaxID=2055159 RepID=UPI001F16B05E
DPFGRKGDILGFIYGQPLKLNNGVAVANVDTGNSTHYEVFYRYLVNDNISITPGFFLVTDPGHISRNNDIFVGTIRTTFSF